MELELAARLIQEYSYAIMVPAAVIFGPAMSLLAGVLLRLEVISIVPTCLALAAGELGADVLWYWLGLRYGDSFVQRWGRYFRITPASIATVKGLFDRHHDVIIFTSKLTAGFGFSIAIFLTAGMLRVPFRRYMMLNIAGQFLWTTGLLSIGYFLGHIYLSISNVFEKMALLALVFILLASLIGFGRYMRERIL